MKSARHTIRQHVVPHTPGAIGPVTGEEAGANLRAQRFIVLTAPTARPCQPGIEAAPRDTQRLAYAADLAQRAASLSPSAVLEIAAGTGVVTRALAPKLSPSASYVVTDLNQPMLDYAASRQGSDSRIKWRQADALDLPFEDASFDVVCCQFGVMFFPNRIAGYTEARRVLRRGV